MQREQPRRNRATEQTGHRNREHEARQSASPLAGRHPLAQVEHDAREKTGFRHSQQQAQSVELVCGLHQGHQGSHHTPAQQDAADPTAGSNPLKDQVAGNLKQHVTEEENSCGDAIACGAEAEILAHPCCREGDVDPIEVGNQIEQEQKRQQMPANSP